MNPDRSAASVRLRYRAEYWLVRAVSMVVGAMPRPAALALGATIGRAFFACDRRHRRLALENLAAAFPQWTARECRHAGRQVFVHFGRLLVEILRFSRFEPADIRAFVRFEGVERVHAAHRAGKGALFITGHFGFWELHALAHGAFFHPVTVVARPLDNPLLHDELERVRTMTGNTVIYRKGGLRRIMKSLAANQGVAVLIDQHIQPADAVVVDFFGRPAATTAAVAVLAARTGAPVIPVFALPLEDGTYRCIYEHPVVPPDDDSPEQLRAFTQRCTDVLEMYVRRYPHLWLWMHRRWREDEVAAIGARDVAAIGRAEEPVDAE